MIGRSIVETTVRSSAATNTLNPTTTRMVAGEGRRLVVSLVVLLVMPFMASRAQAVRS